MNYRHAFHAGNFADVFKHAILAHCLSHLKKKPAPLRVLDVHAGIGRYDLAGIEAGKTLEWADGIGRLLGLDAAPLPAAAAAALEPYLGVVRALNPDGRLSTYPGSPLIARALLGADDALLLNELHPEDRATLAAECASDARIKVTGLDAWTALKAFLPPKEKRGLVLVDPPFEDREEFAKMAQGLAAARRRFASGVYLLWYPVKDEAAVAAFFAAISLSPADKYLRTELLIRAPEDPAKLNGCGMLVLNPPFTLPGALDAAGPVLAERLARGPGARFALAAHG